MKRITATLAVIVLFIMSVRGQGFLNLNFESAQNLPGNPGNNGASVPVADALPDWTAYNDGGALAYIQYVRNSFPGISTVIELEGGTLALSGNYSLGVYGNGSISQTATVASDAESLQFESSGPESLDVTLGGQTLSYSILSQGPRYTVYGANIPAGLDGQTETLTFGIQGSGVTLLDNINFSTLSVPEPSEGAFIAVGAVLVGLCPRRKPSIGGSAGI